MMWNWLTEGKYTIIDIFFMISAGVCLGRGEYLNAFFCWLCGSLICFAITFHKEYKKIKDKV